MLVCGLESGVMWILHPDTLDPLDETPFKHSTEAILNITFSDNSIYMAYSVKIMLNFVYFFFTDFVTDIYRHAIIDGSVPR